MLHQDSHTISLLVANKPGVLLRIALVFSRRGFNVESLVVSPTQDGRFSRMTISAIGNPSSLEQIVKQCSKLVDVVHAMEHSESHAVESELGLIKVEIEKERRQELLGILDHFRAETMDITQDSVIFRMTGTRAQFDTLMGMLSEFKVAEVVRTGKIVIARGREVT